MKFEFYVSILIINKITFKTAEETISDNYDFIVVGAGSAGSVIASRLSEIPNWKILLLEAGEEENLLCQIPITVSILQFTRYNWRFFMQYQPGIGLGLENNRMPWPRGKALGGTSVINYMIYTRGQPSDYDKWAANGNPGWSYKDVLPYFIKSENCRLTNPNYKYHGIDGYLSVEDVYQSEIAEGFIESGKELGLEYIDYNANKSLGISKIQGTLSRGKRDSVAKAFLRPIKHRPNLHILTSAFVTKLLINNKNKVAYGVEYERFGEKYKVDANKEVILSAGTFNSPQLLMLAGIGPKEHLKELEIPVLKDLKVGQNLQDHLTFLGLSVVTNQDVSLKFSQVLNLGSIYEYLVNGSGPISCIGGTQAIAYIKTPLSEVTENIPDIELLFAGASLATDFGILFRTGMAITDEVYNAMFAPIERDNSFSVLPTLLHPKSKGYLKLRSTSPYDYPLLYGNYFTDPQNHDINTLLAGIRFFQKMLRTKAFRKYNVTLNPNRLPGCSQHKFDSDLYWKCCLRSLSETVHHQVGTAKMGPKSDPEAVVNHELKVYGISRLRVADCSVIPFALGAHTNAPAIMIGEKAADLIKIAWGVEL